MKFLLTSFIICILGTSANAQTPNPNYDSILAKKLNADDYGMKSYVLVI